MIKQSGIRSCGGRRARRFRLIAGATILAISACAEIEVGSEVYKTFTRTNGKPIQPVIPKFARPDAIDVSLRADPESYYATGLALWDGERTLAGIWIAHPMVQVARRVRLTNNETGTQVDAAMFQRDPNLSGPRIIVSSEAAELLGLVPGIGTQITIEGLTYGPADIAVASTVPATVDTDPEVTPASASAPASIQAKAATAEPAVVEVAPIADLSSVPPGTPPAPTLTAPTLTAPVSAPVEAAPVADTGDQNDPEPTTGTASVNDTTGIERTGQVPLETETAAISVPATEAPLPLVRPVVQASVQETAPKSESAPDPSGDITDGRRFIQAGVFGQPENASRLVEKLRAADLPAKEVSVTLGDRLYTRVVIGPYQTIAERNAALEVIRTVGPADATPVRG